MATLTGFLSGIMGGMGIGGGIVLIPMLTIILGVDQKIAQSTNLICYLPIALSCLPIHIKNKNIELSITKKIVPFGIIGAILGSYLAVHMPSAILKKLFAFFLLAMGIREITHKRIQ
ncbi:TSUP family transporter [Alkalibaculum sp. M08DMB]|uniref:Probable membrane transporter protein n=1 Tax=Alkalibaculum sporogenes TaxID=2655001 RepID=A0A6A7KC21_9FIRM|nr:sulfite exporter TauE/SafE family protein [Alkalibaculum sporogenes]MPW27058.1 TSUP family transporter [Alkalibaculum sporogenes]